MLCKVQINLLSTSRAFDIFSIKHSQWITVRKVYDKTFFIIKVPYRWRVINITTKNIYTI